MAFAQEATRTPTAIADIEVRLYSPDPTGDEVAGATYGAQIRMSDGSVVVRTGDLTPQLTQPQINSLLAFMAAMRAKAVDEFLP